MASTDQDQRPKVSRQATVLLTILTSVVQPSSLRSIIAGSTAGAVEVGMSIDSPLRLRTDRRQHLLTYCLLNTAITYPAECAQLVLSSRHSCR
jgi:hypothetical protein